TLHQAVFDDTELGGCDFTGVDLSSATVAGNRRPRMGRTRDTRTNFTNATLNFALLGLDWRYLNLTKATFTNMPVMLPAEPANPGAAEAPAWDLRNLVADFVILTDVELPNAVLTQASLQQAGLQRTNLNGATLNNAKLGGAVLAGAYLNWASLVNTDLTMADLSNAQLAYAALTGLETKLSGATMLNTDLTGAYLLAADFSGIGGLALQGCNFVGACLVNANFSGTTVSKAGDQLSSFVGACLQGANFTNARLFGVNMGFAAVAEEDGELVIHHRGRTRTQKYGPTTISEDCTDATTMCPIGHKGPCTEADMQSNRSPMHEWPSQQIAHLLRDAESLLIDGE
ncbi:pentapeptide repeat-containing protein, partial [Hymenobacter agri]